MEAGRKRNQYQTRTNYIDGNTARKRDYIGQNAIEEYSAVPSRERRQLPTQQRQAAVPERQVSTPQRPVSAPQRQVYRQPKQLSGINGASLLILTLAIGATLYFCIEFLMLQNQVSGMEKNIVSMERELTTLRKENDAAYEQINTVYDLDYVYGVAVNELGMVYPNNNEVITFEKTDDGYVRQYADIPK